MSTSGRPKILVVDDEVGIRELLMEILSDEGYLVLTAENAEKAWEVRLSEKLALILLDIWMPGKDGLTLLKQWAESGLTGVPIIVMSGHATIDTAVEAMKFGAQEVLEKPIATNRLLLSLQSAINSGKAPDTGSPQIQSANLGKTPVMQYFKKQLLEASTTDKPVLMVGMPNSGTSFFAQMFAPPRGPMVFVDRNAQLETGIQELLRRASGGIIIVRMIDVLNSVQQSGLLALIKEASRAGVRVIACAMEKPEVLEGDRDFNGALLTSLSHHIITQPPLIQYDSDIACIADFAIQRLSETTGLPARRLSKQAAQLLENRHYENDFAELLSLLRTAMMHSPSNIVDAQTMQRVIEQFNLGMEGVEKGAGDIFSLPLRDARITFEREYFRRLMETARGSIQQAAKISNLERTYLYRKLKQYKEGKEK